MRRFNLIQFAAIAALGLTTMPISAAAERTPTATAPPSSHAPAVTDVALSAGGVLRGQVVDAGGRHIANVAVSVAYAGRAAANARTNSQGYFAVRGLRGGTYQVCAAGGGGVYRLWAENTAPPRASSGLLIFAGSDAVRGQDASWAAWVSGPRLIMFGVMGGAVTAGVIAKRDQRVGS
jgi:hypothetical protein